MLVISRLIHFVISIEKLEIAEETKALLKEEDSLLIKEFYETKYHTILK
jgi:hypothetical protein